MKCTVARPLSGRHNTRIADISPAKPPVYITTRATMETDALVSPSMLPLVLPLVPSPPIRTTMRATMKKRTVLSSRWDERVGYYGRNPVAAVS